MPPVLSDVLGCRPCTSDSQSSDCMAFHTEIQHLPQSFLSLGQLEQLQAVVAFKPTARFHWALASAFVCSD